MTTQFEMRSNYLTVDKEVYSELRKAVGNRFDHAIATIAVQDAARDWWQGYVGPIDHLDSTANTPAVIRDHVHVRPESPAPSR